MDFFCSELMLAIELDGISHQWEETMEKDIIRDKKLNDLGIYVLRIKDKDLMNDFDNVMRVLVNVINERSKGCGDA